jgi:hypothetical protein
MVGANFFAESSLARDTCPLCLCPACIVPFLTFIRAERMDALPEASFPFGS